MIVLLVWLASLIGLGVFFTQPIWLWEVLFAIEMRLPKVVEEL